MKELLKSLSETIQAHQSQEANGIIFDRPLACKKIDYSLDNFHHLEKTTHVNEIYYIDGGSSEIIATHAFSLLFVRTAYVAYQNFSKTKSEVKDWYIYARIESDAIAITVYSDGGKMQEQFSFSLADETLRIGKQHVSVTSAAHTIRRFLELRLATQLAEQANSGDIIVLDGSLHATVTHEKKYLDIFFETCLQHDVLACALSKTTKLMTTQGVSISLVLSRMAKQLPITEKRWYYHPFVEMHDSNYPAELFMIKLHPQTKHLFVFEIYKEQKRVHMEKVLGSLALTSQDPVFLGYPYGLVKVDELARVTNEEINYIRMRLSEHVNLEELEQDISAHAILDSIKF